jgi:DNA invertase Pin-like site-specific DNA recombinase
VNLAYLRLSTTEDKQKNSFEVQLKEIETHYKIDKTYKETISGGAELRKRKALLELLESIKKGDNIIVMRYDRLSRDTVQSGWIRQEMVRKGGTLISIENPKSDSTSKLIENILLAFAQFEKETTKWRINKAFENKKSKGEALGGHTARYGYEFYFENGIKKIRENKKEQVIIKRIKKLKNRKIGKIVGILHHEGAVGKGGKPITRLQVKRILKHLEVAK